MRPSSPSPSLSSQSGPLKETEAPQDDGGDILLKLDVDLASIPVLAAPSIGDDSRQPSSSLAVSDDVLHELSIPPGDLIPFEEAKTKITVAGTINRIEAELVLPLPMSSLSEEEVLSHIESRAGQQIHNSGDSASVVTDNTTQHGLAYRGVIEQGRAAAAAAVSTNGQPRDALFVDTNNLNLLLNQVSALMDEAVQLRGAIPDLSDAQAGKMRAVRLAIPIHTYSTYISYSSLTQIVTHTSGNLSRSCYSRRAINAKIYWVWQWPCGPASCFTCRPRDTRLTLHQSIRATGMQLGLGLVPEVRR